MKITKAKLKQIIKEEISSVMAEMAGGVEEIERHVWQQNKPHARDDAYDAAIDVPLMQDAMGPEYYVVDANDMGAFRTYVQDRGAKGPNGGEVIVPLATLARGDQRINYFKTAHTNIYYRLVS